MNEPSTGWPTDSEIGLLKACLWRGEEGAEAWREWRSTVEFDDITHASLRQLPLAWRNLGDAVADDPVWGRVKGIYRRSWTSNQLSFRAAAPLVAELERAGVQTLVLKGTAYSFLHYGDMGSRWMADVDVLVDPARLAEATAILEGAGWTSTEGDPSEMAAVRHSTPFVAADGVRQIDLHWHSLWLPAPDDDFWAEAVPFDFLDAPTRALAPADQILHACIHGLEWNPAQIHWAADVYTVIASGEVDWERLVERARARAVTVFAAEALGYVAGELHAVVPSDVLSELRAGPAARRERATFEAVMRPPGPGRTLRIFRDVQLRQHELDVPGPRSDGYIDHLRGVFGVERKRDLVPLAAKRLAGRRARG
ncbi:hypothetical protein BH10ACT11_BH10ACT11_22230 [soil metagenome]